MNTIQNLFKIISLTIILFSFSCFHIENEKVVKNDDGEVNIKGIAENRDITQYEQGGHFYCNRWADKNKAEVGEKQVFEFILRHLNEKKYGYIRISCYGVETSYTSHIFVEPDEIGEWNITVRVIGKHSMKEYEDNKISESRYHSVECLENYSETVDGHFFIKQKMVKAYAVCNF